MSVEKILLFIMNHNAGLIEAIVALILLLVLFLSYRAFKAAPETAEASAGIGNLSELEATLKKLLDKASVVPSSAGAASGGASTELLAEIETLKNNLKEKQTEIESLKTSAESAGGGGTGEGGLSEEDKAKLEAQLKELKGKLEEYEIISEDIADLSFYKEENAKLLKQLEAAKITPAAATTEPAAAPAAPAPAAVETAAPTPEPVVQDPVVAAEQSVTIETAPAADPAPAAAEAPAAPITGVDEELMAELDQAVAEQAPSEAAAATTPASATDAGADLGSMDMEKMMAEAEDIGDSAAAVEEAPNALEATLDADKLIEEASALTSPTGTAVKTEDKNLMNEFENFVKGS
jgi:hypothetical protein